MQPALSASTGVGEVVMALFYSLQTGMIVHVIKDIGADQQRLWRADERSFATAYLRGAEMKVIEFGQHPKTKKRIVLLQPVNHQSYPAGALEQCFGVPEDDFAVFFG